MLEDIQYDDVSDCNLHLTADGIHQSPVSCDLISFIWVLIWHKFSQPLLLFVFQSCDAVWIWLGAVCTA